MSVRSSEFQLNSFVRLSLARASARLLLTSISITPLGHPDSLRQKRSHQMTKFNKHQACNARRTHSKITATAVVPPNRLLLWNESTAR